MSAWQRVRLAELLRRSSETVDPLPDTEYREITVRLWGKGVVERGRTTGLAMTGRRFVARDGQFIASRIDARNGATGLVPASLDGALVTNDFPLFELNRDRLHPSYFGWLSRTASFVELCRRASEGTTNRVRLKEEEFLALEISLPPLPEQQRLVARIDAMSKLLEQGLRLNSQSVAEATALARAGRDAVYARLAARYGVVDVASLCKTITDGDHNTPAFSEEGVPFVFVGNVSSGKLHFEGSKRVHPEYFARLSTSRVPKRGDVLFSAVGASLGVPAVVDTDTGFCFQRHIAILKPDHDRVVPQFLWHMLMSRTCFDMTWSNTTGSAQPTIPLHAIRALKIPQPPLAEQHRIVAELDALQAEVDALKAAQTASRAELDALLPAVLDRAFAGAL